MLTVTFGFEGSGKSRTRRPFGYVYSVMPPRVDFCSTPRGRVCENAGRAAPRNAENRLRDIRTGASV